MDCLGGQDRLFGRMVVPIQRLPLSINTTRLFSKQAMMSYAAALQRAPFCMSWRARYGIAVLQSKERSQGAILTSSFTIRRSCMLEPAWLNLVQPEPTRLGLGHVVEQGSTPLLLVQGRAEAGGRSLLARL